MTSDRLEELRRVAEAATPAGEAQGGMTTQAGVSERRLGSVGELTPDRLAELQRIAEAATPGPWAWRMSKDGRILDLIVTRSALALIKGGGGA